MDKGQYTITLDHERGLVRVYAQGEFDGKLGEELITNARKKAAEHQYNILCDVRESRAVVSLGDWYFLPRRLAAYKNRETRTVRTAIVVSTGRQEKVYRFFENVTSNLGLKIRIFLHEEDALEWLVVSSK
jgi:hypothetical protein